MRKALKTWISFGQWLLASLLSLLALRFAFSTAGLMATGGEKGAAKGAASARSERAQRRIAPSARVAVPSAVPTSSGFVRVMISVSHGQERSEVFIDGDLVGNTPFVGDIPCRPEQMIKVQIVPLKGPVIERERRCQGETVTVAE